jgi:hypothetical protein
MDGTRPSPRLKPMPKNGDRQVASMSSVFPKDHPWYEAPPRENQPSKMLSRKSEIAPIGKKPIEDLGSDSSVELPYDNESESGALNEAKQAGTNTKTRKGSSGTSDEIDGSGSHADISGNDDESSSENLQLVDMVPERIESLVEESENKYAALRHGRKPMMIVAPTEDASRHNAAKSTAEVSEVGAVSLGSSSSHDGPSSGVARASEMRQDCRQEKTTESATSHFLTGVMSKCEYDAILRDEGERVLSREHEELAGKRSRLTARKDLGTKRSKPGGNSGNISDRETRNEAGAIMTRKHLAASTAGNEQDPLVLSDSSYSSDEESNKGRSREPPGTTSKKTSTEEGTEQNDGFANSRRRPPSMRQKKTPLSSSQDTADDKCEKACESSRDIEVGERVYAKFSENRVRWNMSEACPESPRRRV